MGQEEFALFDQNIGLQTRPKLIQHDGLSYKSHPCVPETQGCDLYTRGYIYIYRLGWRGVERGREGRRVRSPWHHLCSHWSIFQMPSDWNTPCSFTWCSFYLVQLAGGLANHQEMIGFYCPWGWTSLSRSLHFMLRPLISSVFIDWLWARSKRDRTKRSPEEVTIVVAVRTL